MKNYIKALLLPLCFGFQFGHAQIDQSKEIEKEVTVDIDDKTGKSVKTIKVKVKNNDGTEKVMEWSGSDESEMPDEMKELMKDVKIMVDEESNGTDITKDVTVHIDGKNKSSKKVKIVKSENGEEHIIEWEGNNDNEIPAEIKKELDDVKVIIRDGGKTSKSISRQEKQVKIRIKEDDGTEKIMEWNGEGEMPAEIKEHMESAEARKKTIRIKKNGTDDVEVYEWDGSSELPADIRKKLEKEGFLLSDENVFIYESDDSANDQDIKIIKDAGDKHIWIDTDDDKIIIHRDGGSQKPRLGIRAENHVDGVRVQSIVDSSPASMSGLEKGDIIYKIDDKNIGSVLQLTDYLDNAPAGKTIKMKVLKSGQKKTIKVKLK